MKKILVIDDSETIRQQVKHALAATGCEIVEAVDGIDGLEKLRAMNDLDIALCDVNMPRMNGLELCMTLRGAGLAADCEIISVNGAATARDRELLSRLGVRQTLTKTPAISRTIVDLMKTSRRRYLASSAGA